MYFFGIDVFLLLCVKHVQDSAARKRAAPHLSFTYFCGIDVLLPQCVKHLENNAAGGAEQARTAQRKARNLLSRLSIPQNARMHFGDPKESGAGAVAPWWRALCAQSPSVGFVQDWGAEINSTPQLKGGTSVCHACAMRYEVRGAAPPTKKYKNIFTCC